MKAFKINHESSVKKIGTILLPEVTTKSEYVEMMFVVMDCIYNEFHIPCDVKNNQLHPIDDSFIFRVTEAHVDIFFREDKFTYQQMKEKDER